SARLPCSRSRAAALSAEVGRSPVFGKKRRFERLGKVAEALAAARVDLPSSGMRFKSESVSTALGLSFIPVSRKGMRRPTSARSKTRGEAKLIPFAAGG